MRHVCLTCRNHTDLRWQCKSIAFTPGHGYNGIRSIFFNGYVEEKDAALDAIGDWAKNGKPGDALVLPRKVAAECPCPPSDLILAPEEIELQKTDPTYDQDGRDIY